MDSLKNRRCSRATTQEVLTTAQISEYITQVPMWQLTNNNSSLYRRLEFKNFKQTMFFINAMSYVVEQEIHHPDVKFGYNYCEIIFTTHDINGISENDFICASKIDLLLAL